MKREMILLSSLLFLTPRLASPGETPPTPAKSSPAAAAIEVRFLDNSVMKVTPHDEKLTVLTRYGKLEVPIRDIRKLELSLRIPADVAKKIEISIKALGHSSFNIREGAGADLLEYGARSYPALREAVKSTDPEVAKRAEDLVAKLKTSIPKEMLEMPENDVITTDDCKITGRVQIDEIKVKTFQFGEQTLKLADVRTIRFGPSQDQEADNIVVQENPGSLQKFQGEIGKTFAFRVTGGNNGSIWGTGIYTSDSDLATAAVHAGALAIGQSGVVKVEIVTPPPGFAGSNQNGINSNPFQGFPGAYRIILVR